MGVQDWHESHQPDEPRTIGFGVDLIYCKACGILLRSSRGPAVNARLRELCVPVPTRHRSALPLDLS